MRGSAGNTAVGVRVPVERIARHVAPFADVWTGDGGALFAVERRRPARAYHAFAIRTGTGVDVLRDGEGHLFAIAGNGWGAVRDVRCRHRIHFAGCARAGEEADVFAAWEMLGCGTPVAGGRWMQRFFATVCPRPPDYAFRCHPFAVALARATRGAVWVSGVSPGMRRGYRRATLGNIARNLGKIAYWGSPPPSDALAPFPSYLAVLYGDDHDVLDVCRGIPSADRTRLVAAIRTYMRGRTPVARVPIDGKPWNVYRVAVNRPFRHSRFAAVPADPASGECVPNGGSVDFARLAFAYARDVAWERTRSDPVGYVAPSALGRLYAFLADVLEGGDPEEGAVSLAFSLAVAAIRRDGDTLVVDHVAGRPGIGPLVPKIA